jgi:hypothetical protein
LLTPPNKRQKKKKKKEEEEEEVNGWAISPVFESMWGSFVSFYFTQTVQAILFRRLNFRDERDKRWFDCIPRRDKLISNYDSLLTITSK